MQPPGGTSRSERKAAERATRDQARRADEQRRAREREEAEFRASPVGQAVAARDRGDGFFQLELDIRENLRTAFGSAQGWSGYNIKQQSRGGQTDVLSAVEAVGWRLEDVGYVFVQTGSVSRDKLLSSGQETGIMGKVVGIYLFRATRPGPAAVDGPYRHG